MGLSVTHHACSLNNREKVLRVSFIHFRRNQMKIWDAGPKTTVGGEVRILATSYQKNILSAITGKAGISAVCLISFLFFPEYAISNSKDIEKAFGMTLGQKVDEALLTSAYKKSELHPGALHAYFRPIDPHPFLSEYSVWVTQESKTVVGIRGFNEENFDFDWDAPGKDRKYQKLKGRWRKHYSDLKSQLRGIYGHLYSPDSSVKRYNAHGRSSFNGDESGRSDEFHGSKAWIKLKNTCSGLYGRKFDAGRAARGKKGKQFKNMWMWCNMALIYRLDELNKLVSKEATGAKGL